MKKFINRIDTLLTESLHGLAAAHKDLVTLHLDPTFVCRAEKAKNKVAVISGGGAGHEPLHTGFVGYGMLDAACPGQVFTSPTPDQMIAAAEATESGRGVLWIVKNYAGDVMNFEMAQELLPFEQATVLIHDDAAIGSNTNSSVGRRGVAGTVILEKMVGSLAETGADLATCKDFCEKIHQRIASMGVALSSCTVPAAGRPTFTLGENELEMGVGIHGEPGRARERVRPASDIVRDLLSVLLEDLSSIEGNELLLLVNGLGGTPLMELYLLYHQANTLLTEKGFHVSRSLVGNYTTALEMAGASLTLCIMDDAMRQHWDAPVHTAALRWGNTVLSN